MRLSDLKQGQTGIIRQVGGGGQLRQHFLDMGLIQGTEITYIKAAPMGDPIEYRIWGYELTLRKDDGAKIEVELVEKREGKKETGEHKSSNFTNHPHIGESGIYHVKQRGETIEKGQLITFGLAGNQNCGKTTLFNQLRQKRWSDKRPGTHNGCGFAGNLFHVTLYKRRNCIKGIFLK